MILIFYDPKRRSGTAAQRHDFLPQSKNMKGNSIEIGVLLRSRCDHTSAEHGFEKSKEDKLEAGR
jgi:hypothetical protein